MIVSLMRGFTVEALSMVTWIAAFVVARLFSLPRAVLIADFIDPPSARQPLAFESSLPGVFAAGDVRFGTSHRVSSATGEGAAAVAIIRQYVQTL